MGFKKCESMVHIGCSEVDCGLPRGANERSRGACASQKV